MSAKEERRKWITNYLESHPCSACGESDIRCLDFHHLGNKNVDVSKALDKNSISFLGEEVSKCVVLCSNCHLKLHKKRKKVERNLNKRQRHKRDMLDYAIEFKEYHPCKCGVDDASCLVFHHNSDKDKKVSSLYNTSWMKFLTEISKCTVMCGNCHRKLHGTPRIPSNT